MTKGLSSTVHIAAGMWRPRAGVPVRLGPGQLGVSVLLCLLLLAAQPVGSLAARSVPGQQTALLPPARSLLQDCSSCPGNAAQTCSAVSSSEKDSIRSSLVGSCGGCSIAIPGSCAACCGSLPAKGTPSWTNTIACMW